MSKSLPQVVGEGNAPFAGRIWVRDFGGSVELLYKSCGGPGQSERLNTWLVEAGGQSIGMIKREFSYGDTVADDLPDDDSGESDRERAMRRARQAVRWKVKAINADRMLTLTHRANITDLAESKAILRKFLDLCRREWPSGWRFVGVPEVQERGAWHWHLAVAGWVNVDKVRGFWWKAHGAKVVWSAEGKPVLRDGGETPGNIDVRAAGTRDGRGKRRGVWQPDRLSGYLSKYIGKSLTAENDVTAGQASYTASRGIQFEVRRFIVRGLAFNDVASVTLDVLKDAGALVPYVWTAPDRRVLWATALKDAPAAGPPRSPSS